MNHNESQSERIEASRRVRTVNWACIGCGYCESVCPTGAIRVDGTAEIDPNICLGCGACAGRCPNGAID